MFRHHEDGTISRGHQTGFGAHKELKTKGEQFEYSWRASGLQLAHRSLQHLQAVPPALTGLPLAYNAPPQPAAGSTVRSTLHGVMLPRPSIASKMHKCPKRWCSWRQALQEMIADHLASAPAASSSSLSNSEYVGIPAHV